MKDKVRAKMVEAEMQNQLLFIDIIEILKKVIEEYDGKILNKNLEKALWNTIDGEFNQEGKRVRYIKMTQYDNSARIEICPFSDTVEDEDTGLCYPLELNMLSIMFMNKTAYRLNETGKWKIEASKIITLLERHKSNLQESYDRLKLDKEKVKKMMSDLQELKSKYELFEKNYGYRIREVYGCLYELKDSNSPYYRNPEV